VVPDRAHGIEHEGWSFGRLRPKPDVTHTHHAQSARRANLTRQIDSVFQNTPWRWPQIRCILPPVPRAIWRGADASSRTLPAGCGGRVGAEDDRHQHGRRSRVVLASRRWGQVRNVTSDAHDGSKKARFPGRARISR